MKMLKNMKRSYKDCLGLSFFIIPGFVNFLLGIAAFIISGIVQIRLNNDIDYINFY